MIVVDASVLVVALLDDDRDGDGARRRLRSETLAAPGLIDLEVLSVVGRHRRAERISELRARQAVDDLAALPITRAPHRPLLPRCLELITNLSAYDAAYVALAEAFGAILLTADARLARAPGPNCAIEVLAGR